MRLSEAVASASVKYAISFQPRVAFGGDTNLSLSAQNDHRQFRRRTSFHARPLNDLQA